jgi:two-component system, sensor histidine kinase and response regulator
MRDEIILIVDDEPLNTKLMKTMLMPEGYEIIDVPSGEAALKAVFRFSPGLILLDVMMPGMNGFEVCKHLKNDDRTKAIPIIMVTALREQVHQLDRVELLIRVKSLLRIKEYHDELLFSYTQIAQKNRKLEELEQLRDDLTHMIVHDLRNPLSALMGLIDLSLLKMEGFREPLHTTLKKCSGFCRDMSGQIEDLLAVQRMENARPIPEIELTDLPFLVDEAVEQFRLSAESKGVFLSFVVPRDLTALPMDQGLIKRVLANLIHNAIRHTPSQGRVEGTVEFSSEEQTLRVSVKDSGDGLAPEYHEKVFNKFEQAKLKREGIPVGSSGLGLTFCKMAVEAHGGSIWAESDGEGRGCTFRFEIPVHIK